MNFKIPFRITAWDRPNLALLNQNLDYINQTMQQGQFFRFVTYSTSMNSDVGGTINEIVVSTTNNKIYRCTQSGQKGSATWQILS